MLGNFSYCNPTKLYFGEKALKSLKLELGKYGDKVLLIYGGGSVKRNGVLGVSLILNKSCIKVCIRHPKSHQTTLV